MEENLFQSLLGIIKRFRLQYGMAVGLMLTANILLIANPLVLRVALSHTERSPFFWSAILFVIAFSSAFLRYRMLVSFSKVRHIVEADLRSRLFERIQRQSMEFFDRHGIGEMIERLSNDMSAYRDMIGPGLLFPVNFITILLPGLLALFWISPLMGALTLIPIFMIPFLNFLLRHDLYIAAKAVQEKLAEMGNFVQEDYSGIRVVKSYAAENSLLHHFSHYCQDFFSLNFRLMCLQGWFSPLFVVLTRVMGIALIVLAGLLFLAPADFVSFMWIQAYIFSPILALGWVIPRWQQGRAAYDRLKEIYDEPIAVKDEGEGNLQIAPNADIILDRLTFAYPNQLPVLKDITLTIKGGSFVGITGPTGAGKSTLFKLLNREYELPRGMIKIGEKDIHDYPLSAFWQEIVSVDQIPFLFSKTIRENVGFGKREATEEEIFWASRLANLHGTVQEFELGYETLVGEKGMLLSGGQKARVTIARAFLVNRSIFLLDDIFASVDNQTALKIFQALETHFKGRTVLLMTSKVSILEKMDRVIYLMQGGIAEEGKPQELLAKKGRFFALKALERDMDV